MALTKHVVGEDGIGRNVEMTQQEEADFLASLPAVNPTMTPNVISDRQFYQQLYVENFISSEEALAAVMVGTLPSPIVGFINNLTEEEQFNARMLLSGAKEFRRDHPLVEQVAGYLNLTSEWIDEFFKKAAAL